MCLVKFIKAFKGNYDKLFNNDKLVNPSIFGFRSGHARAGRAEQLSPASLVNLLCQKHAQDTKNRSGLTEKEAYRCLRAAGYNVTDGDVCAGFHSNIKKGLVGKRTLEHRGHAFTEYFLASTFAEEVKRIRRQDKENAEAKRKAEQRVEELWAELREARRAARR